MQNTSNTQKTQTRIWCTKIKVAIGIFKRCNTNIELMIKTFQTMSYFSPHHILCTQRRALYGKYTKVRCQTASNTQRQLSYSVWLIRLDDGKSELSQQLRLSFSASSSLRQTNQTPPIPEPNMLSVLQLIVVCASKADKWQRTKLQLNLINVNPFALRFLLVTLLPGAHKGELS